MKISTNHSEFSFLPFDHYVTGIKNTIDTYKDNLLSRLVIMILSEFDKENHDYDNLLSKRY